MENRITIPFQARYEILGIPSSAIDQIWFVCHGHGQLAKYFIRKFEEIDNGKTLIVAPEGLFKYYLQGFTGRVGATWMTKEDRLNDIENYLTYLSAVMNEVKSKVKKDVQVTLLGFSQGGATISRFATQTDVHFDRLVLWAGIFPPDLPPLESNRKLRDKECLLVYGTDDEYLTEARIAEQKSIATEIKIVPETLTFKGGHELNKRLLQEINERPYRQN
ncbi:alpha/beta hydrolase [Roseivirga sp.]|uniref:alpha/beta hydrolase n=1 Tax=Roseivirga sp. TaxID=1964215 RepID=UPI003B8C7C5E